MSLLRDAIFETYIFQTFEEPVLVLCHFILIFFREHGACNGCFSYVDTSVRDMDHLVVSAHNHNCVYNNVIKRRNKNAHTCI